MHFVQLCQQIAYNAMQFKQLEDRNKKLSVKLLKLLVRNRSQIPKQMQSEMILSLDSFCTYNKIKKKFLVEGLFQ